jgi:hypothetical protein
MPLPTPPTPPPAPQPTGFRDFIQRMQLAYQDRPTHLLVELRSLDKQRVPDLFQQRVPDLYLIENEMWEATQAIEPHLDDLCHRDSEDMVNHVYENTEENLPITPRLEACQIAEPFDYGRGTVETTVETTMGERTIDDEFNYLALEIYDVTREFMGLQRTMTTALQRYTACLLLSDRIHHLCMVVIAAEHIGFDSRQKAYIESAIPDLAFMEKHSWEQSREIKPHLENIFESMANQ